jgi:hypothetical protein
MPTLKSKPGLNERGFTASVRAWIEGLGPYPSLLLLAIPFCIVEPMKFVAVAIAGDGHWITGTSMIVAAYAASLLVVERLFGVVKPKLLMLPWFAKAWVRFVMVRARLLRAVGWERKQPRLEQPHERLL